MSGRVDTANGHGRALAVFAGLVVCVYATAAALAGRLTEIDAASAVAVGMTLDMVVVVPLAYYWLVVRRRGWPVVAVVPVVVVSMAVAARVVPADHQALLRGGELLLVPAELTLVGWIVWRAAVALRTAGRDRLADPLLRFQLAGEQLLHNRRVAAVFASEIAVFYYALFSWRARPHVPPGARPFSYHRESGLGGVVFGFAFLCAVEGLAVHWLLMQWSSVAAWVLTALTCYGALWLIADYRASVLRPILVEGTHVWLRFGLRSTMRVPKTSIVAVASESPGAESRSLMILGTPPHWIVFDEPVTAEGPYGLRSRWRAVGVELDEVAGFSTLLDLDACRS